MIHALSMREKMMLLVGLISCLFTLGYYAVIQPYNAAIERLDTKIASRSDQLSQVQQLQQQFRRIQGQMKSLENRQKKVKDFALFSFIENNVTRIAKRENLTSMRPLPTVSHDNMTEQSIEIRLENVSLGQVMQLLQSIDSAPAPLQVKKLQLKVRFDNRQQLDGTMLIAEYSKK